MAYIVPKEMPKSCHDCQFHYCSEYHPFWSADKEKRNTQTIRCQAITPFRSTILDIKDKTFKPDWCPLVEAADVQKMQSQINRLKRYDKERDIALHARLVDNAKTEVARAIFEEIEEAIEKCKYNQSTPFGIEERYNPYAIIKQVAELKKKYTEGKTNAEIH